MVQSERLVRNETLFVARFPAEDGKVVGRAASKLVITVTVKGAHNADALGFALSDAVEDIPGLLGNPAPVLRLVSGPANGSVTVELVCGVARVLDRYGVEHALRRRINHTLRCERPRLAFEIQAAVIREAEEG